MIDEIPPVTISFAMDATEYHRTWRTLCLRRGGNWLCLSIGPILIAIGLSGSRPSIVAAGVVLLVLMIVQICVFAPRRAWERLEPGPYAYTFAEEGVLAAGSRVESKIDWLNWSELSLVGVMYVLRGVSRYNLIPRRAFESPAEEERFLEIAAQKGLDLA